MAFKIAEAYVEFSQKGISSITGATGKAEKAMRGVANAGRMASAAFVGFATGEGARGLMFLVDSAAEAEKQTAKLNAVLLATKGVSGQTVASLEAHASALQKVTAFEDDTIKGAQAVLLTFKKIGGETFPQATEAALDLATVFEGDLKGAAMMVGKALEDPIKGITALSRAGVSFTADQKEMIKSLVATGDAAKAQALILAEIQSQVGGSARAVGNTAEGAIAQFRNAMGDLAEEVGSVLLPAVKALTAGIRQAQLMLHPEQGVKIFGDRAGALSKDLAAAKTREEARAIQGKLRDLRKEAGGVYDGGASAKAVDVASSFANSYAMQKRISNLPSQSAMIGGIPVPKGAIGGAEALKDAFKNAFGGDGAKKNLDQLSKSATDQLRVLEAIRDKIGIDSAARYE